MAGPQLCVHVSVQNSNLVHTVLVALLLVGTAIKSVHIDFGTARLSSSAAYLSLFCYSLPLCCASQLYTL